MVSEDNRQQIERIVKAIKEFQLEWALELSLSFSREAHRNADAQALAGLTRLRFGNVATSEIHLRHALSLNADHVEAHLGLGEIAYGRAKLAEAVDHLQKATDSKLFPGEAYLALSRCHLDRGELAESVHYAELALQTHDNLSLMQKGVLRAHIEFYSSLGQTQLYEFPRSFESTSIEFTRGGTGHIFMPVNLNGNFTESLVLDTGNSAETIISKEMADQLELEYSGRFEGLGASGEVSFSRAQLKKMQIGDLALENVPVNVSHDELAGGIKGAIGRSILQRLDVTIDFPGLKVYFFNRNNKLQQKRIESEEILTTAPFHFDRIPIIEAVIAGQPAAFILDTGAPVVILNQDYFADRLEQELPDENVQEAQIMGASGEPKSARMFTIDELQIGGYNFEQQMALATDLNGVFRETGCKYAGIVGMSPFLDSQLHFNFSKSELTVTRA